MSHAQWKYLLATRSVTNTLSDGARYTMATLGNTYKGLIIFPDDYTHPDGTDFVAGTYNSSSNFTANVSLAGWALMESAGCVFLPAAGFYSAPRDVFDGFGKAVEINTTTSYSSNDYYTPAFKIDLADCDATSNKNSWMSVRLVQVWIDSNVANLQKDADGYYLIGSVNDWKGFAAIVNNEINTAANARMIADIDLGDDQTYISPTWHGEFSSQHYHGTFDGQGHTLTVHYNSSNMFHTPFSQTSGATIKNLHVAGTIKSTSSEPSHMSGLVSNSAGSDVIQNVWVSADIEGGSNAWIECGAFVGCNNCGNTTITDCLFTGSITTKGGNNGCFAGYNQGYQNSTITTNNCLSTGSFKFTSGTVSRGTINNSYVKSYPNSIPANMQVTDAQLSDGTIATKLQDGRSEVIWVQDPVTNQPMLAIFPAVMLGDVNGDHNIDENDLDVIVKIVMGETPPGIQKQAGDLNNDGKVDAADVVKMVDILNSAGETQAASALSEATTDDIGKIVGADGKIYDNATAALDAGTTAAAIIAYVGSAGSVDASSASYKGLAIAMSDANSSSTCAWYTDHSGSCVSRSDDIATAITYKNGIECTNTLVNSNGTGVTTTCSGHYHAAAIAARNNNGIAAPTGTSDWFLPSLGQWNLIVQGLATKKTGSAVTTNLSESTNSTYYSFNLNSVITDVGGTGFRSALYGSSSEYDAWSSWHMHFAYGSAGCTDKSGGKYVRSVIAF